jgi:hypothetical protein
MGRPFIPDDGFRVAELGHFLLDRLDAPLQLPDILLLPEDLFVELADGFVLHGRKGFEFNDAFFHGGRIANLAGKESGFMGFCIEAFGELA